MLSIYFYSISFFYSVLVDYIQPHFGLITSTFFTIMYFSSAVLKAFQVGCTSEKQASLLCARHPLLWPANLMSERSKSHIYNYSICLLFSVLVYLLLLVFRLQRYGLLFIFLHLFFHLIHFLYQLLLCWKVQLIFRCHNGFIAFGERRAHKGVVLTST